MADKRRVQLWLSKELIERGQAAAARIPGMSLSLYVDELLDDGVPMLEAIADIAESAEPSERRNLFANALAGNVVRMLEELEPDGT